MTFPVRDTSGRRSRSGRRGTATATGAVAVGTAALLGAGALGLLPGLSAHAAVATPSPNGSGAEAAAARSKLYGPYTISVTARSDARPAANGNCGARATTLDHIESIVKVSEREYRVTFYCIAADDVDTSSN